MEDISKIKTISNHFEKEYCFSSDNEENFFSEFVLFPKDSKECNCELIIVATHGGNKILPNVKERSKGILF